MFCQIIKQLTANPSNDSVQRGWELMVLCLSTFPPPSDFENYCEMYLRSFGNPPAKFVNLLHDTMFGGAKRSPPSRCWAAELECGWEQNSTSIGGGELTSTASRHVLPFD